MSNRVDTSPTNLVIFGATGDLAGRKLLPALLDLYAQGYLPRRFHIVGFSRRNLTNNDWREFARQAINRKQHGHSVNKVNSFLKKLSYRSGTFEDPEAYGRLAEHLIKIDDRFGQCANKLFYLAVPPSGYKIIFKNLANSGMTIPCSDKTGWIRVLVEKPFGKDIKSARELDRLLGLLFKEEQIFRIDHYLAKETVQNLLTFRFSNTLFSPLWNTGGIEKVHITLFEKMDVGNRGAFYNEVGALRDVGENHALQLLALVAMDNPIQLKAEKIRKARAKLLSSLSIIKAKQLTKKVVRGQYRGFVNEKNVPKNSKTETYFKIEANINTDRWKNVSFILESGKALQESTTEINVYFRNPIGCLCPPGSSHDHQNVLTFRIQPNEGLSVRLWAKKPGLTFDLEPQDLHFKYGEESGVVLPDAYEKVLFDCIKGDQTLFAGTDEVLASWRFITPILNNWQKLPLLKYKKGSRVPGAAIN